MIVKEVNGMNTLRAEEVHFTDSHLNIRLNDGRIISAPLEWFPELQCATVRQLRNYSLICRGTGIEWNELDYHLSIESMLSANFMSPQRHIA
jgi:hypothetical protein